MKKTSAEILEMRALQAVNKAKNVFSWNMDITFAKLMLPCVKAYYKKAEKTIDTSYICMPLFLRNKMMDREGCKSKWFLKIKKYYHKNYIKHMKDFIDALEDVLIETTDKWEKKWNMKPFKKIEYDSIPCKWNEKGEAELFSLEVNEKYKENDKINYKNMSYNSKQQQKCYKWRQKQFKWFINNINKLWW